MFILVLTYLKDLSEIDGLMAEHREYLDRNYREGTFLLSGRQVPRTGGVILALGDDRDAITKITQTDPFAREGVARYDIIQMTPTAASESLGAALTAAGIGTLQPAG